MNDQEGQPYLKRIPALNPSDVEISADNSGTIDTGIKEAQLLTQGFDEDEIRKKSAESEHRRNETFRDHFELIAVIFLYIVAGLFFFVGATWFWHLLLPDSWHWLTEPQISKLQNIVTGGIIASIATGHVKKRLS